MSLRRKPATGLARCSVRGRQAVASCLASVFSACYQAEMAGPHSANAECYVCGTLRRRRGGSASRCGFVVEFHLRAKGQRRMCISNCLKKQRLTPALNRTTTANSAVVAG